MFAPTQPSASLLCCLVFFVCFFTISAIIYADLMSPPADYGSAIETLVTAISLIKQSKVSADDRCKVLISSLQDCLHGIESKSYGSASRYCFTSLHCCGVFSDQVFLLQ